MKIADGLGQPIMHLPGNPLPFLNGGEGPDLFVESRVLDGDGRLGCQCPQQLAIPRLKRTRLLPPDTESADGILPSLQGRGEGGTWRPTLKEHAGGALF
jgi:hypothetical protein